MIAALLLGGWELLLIGGLSTFGLAFLIFWIWMLVDCIRNKRLSDNERLIWSLVIIFTHALGALIYLVAGRNKAT